MATTKHRRHKTRKVELKDRHRSGGKFLPAQDLVSFVPSVLLRGLLLFRDSTTYCADGTDGKKLNP